MHNSDEPLGTPSNAPVTPTKQYYINRSNCDPVQRDEKRERLIWEHHIQPVIQKCGFGFEFEFVEGDVNELDIYKMLRLMISVCFFMMDRFKSVEEIIYDVRMGKPLTDELKNLLFGFFKQVDKERTLPAFLELLSDDRIFSESGSKTEKKPHPRRIIINECRTIAAELWKTDATITIPQMYNRSEIRKAVKGPLPASKTFRRWMQGLNPNPRGGRRLGT